MFGVNSAPEILQRILEGILAPCENCLNYLDNITIFSSTEVEHDRCLASVMKTLQENNVLLNEEKCIMKATQITFLGHKLSSKGIDADQHKIKTIMGFRSPASKEEVRSFLKLVTYVGKFIADLGSTFYFNPKRRTRLVADASPVALGAVLLQFDDREYPQII